MRALILFVGAPVMEFSVVLAVIISGACVYDAAQNISASEADRLQAVSDSQNKLSEAFIRGDLSAGEYAAAMKQTQL